MCKLFYHLLVFFFKDEEFKPGFVWNLLKDFALPIALAGVAAYAAYYIFIKETSRDKQKEENRLNSERNDKLLYFSALVSNCLKVSIEQEANLRQHIRAIEVNDVDFHLQSFVPLTDFIRVSNSLNLESYLLAYVNNYQEDRKEAIKEFKGIVTSIDFLLTILQQQLDQLQKAQTYDYERKLKFQSIFSDSYRIIAIILHNIPAEPPPVYEQINVIIENYRTSPQPNTLQHSYDTFIFPIYSLCAQYVQENFQSTNWLYQQILELSFQSKSAIDLFALIKAHNQDFRRDLNGDLEKISKAIIDLQNSSNRILANFG